MQPKVSIIVVNWNGLKWLSSLFFSIEKQSYRNYEVIFVDNNSQDNSVRFVKDNYPNVKVVKSNKNIGFGGAANLGALKSDGEFLAFFNEDMRLDKDLIANLVSCFQKQDRHIGMISATEKGYEDWDSHKYYGYNADIFLYTQPVKNNMNFPRKFFYAPGAPGFIKKSVFDLVNGYDRDLFLYYEDVDLSWRVRLSGFEVVGCPSAVVYHSGGGVTNRRSAKILILQRRNQVALMIKNYSNETLIKVLPAYLLNVLVLSLVQLKNREFRNFWTGNVALLDVILVLPSLIKKRNKIQSTRKVSDQEIIRTMSPSYLGFVGIFKGFYQTIWRALL